MSELSKKQREEEKCKQETTNHIVKVQKYIKVITDLLIKRGKAHDDSKLHSPELEIFTEYTPKLAAMTYGSDEYKECLKGMGPALQHHYASNTHHPEHYPNGIEGMDLIDVIEMFCDNKAASLRHNDGDFMKSLEINIKRFKIEPQLAQILLNTAPLMFQYSIEVFVSGVRKHTYVADKLEVIHSKIQDDKEINDSLKDTLINGVSGEFKFDYHNKQVNIPEDEMVIKWSVNKVK